MEGSDATPTSMPLSAATWSSSRARKVGSFFELRTGRDALCHDEEEQSCIACSILLMLLQILVLRTSDNRESILGNHTSSPTEAFATRRGHCTELKA